jgi:multisubunit Na+/H+ antiporter MnhG subunit
VIQALLLAVAVLVLLACGAGVLLTHNALDRLHYLGPATILAPLAVAAAVWVRHGWDQPSIKATLVLLLVWITAPVLTHVTARATVGHSERVEERP